MVTLNGVYINGKTLTKVLLRQVKVCLVYRLYKKKIQALAKYADSRSSGDSIFFWRSSGRNSAILQSFAELSMRLKVRSLRTDPATSISCPVKNWRPSITSLLQNKSSSLLIFICNSVLYLMLQEIITIFFTASRCWLWLLALNRTEVTCYVKRQNILIQILKNKRFHIDIIHVLSNTNATSMLFST